MDSINLPPMKTQRKQQRNINSISTGRWTAYVGAAVASSFAAAHTAEATIHYSGLINQKIGGNQRVTFPLDPAGGSFVVRHFKFFYGSSSVLNGGVAQFFVYAGTASVNAVSGACHANNPCVSRLDLRDAISARPFVPAGGTLAWVYGGFSHSTYGQFLDPGIGLTGFKFNNGAGDQYGWVRVRMGGAPLNRLEVIDYAYGDPGDKVLAGQKTDGSAPMMESLGGLALGAAGLLAWRRRKQTPVH